MNENRKKDLLNQLKGGNETTRDKCSANQLINILQNVNDQIKKTVFEETHVKALSEQDVVSHLDNLAKQYGCIEMPELVETRKNIKDLTNKIRCLRIGQKGERYGQQALGNLQSENIILRNITLKKEESIVECDFLVINANAIFIVEVKNNTHNMEITKEGNYVRSDGKYSDKVYNIGVNMNSKRKIVKQILDAYYETSGRKLSVPVKTIILYASNYSKLVDNYHYEQVCYCSTLPHFIDNFEGNGNALSKEEMKEIASFLKVENVILEYPIGVDIDKIYDNLATVIAILEEEAEKQRFAEEFEKSLVRDSGEGREKEVSQKKANHRNIRRIFRNVGKGSVGLALLGTGALCVLWKKR